jgi:hypothetical protein
MLELLIPMSDYWLAWGKEVAYNCIVNNTYMGLKKH